METPDQKSGKGKAKDNSPAPVPPDALLAPNVDDNSSVDNRSVISRVAGSAIGLRDSLLSSRPREDDMAQVLSTEKGQRSSQRSSALSADAGESSSASRPVGYGATSGFRQEAVQQRAAEEEKAFSSFLDNVPAGTVGLEIPNHIKLPEPQQNPDGHTELVSRRPDTVPEQELQDGAAVVDLLSRGDADVPDFVEEAGVSEVELASLRRALFNGPRTGDDEWDSVLNFIPDFIRPDPNGEFEQTSQRSWKSEETFSSLGLSHSYQAGRIWVEQWQEVLSRYTDDVWGDLAPLVKEVEAELEGLGQEAPDAPGSPNLQALRRLRQLLGHIRNG